ncbi:MAG: YbdD/YjiX family protein [Nitrospirae bacterium]|nr:YbdD/YjiX family protein [Nitrospirota bacterium]
MPRHLWSLLRRLTGDDAYDRYLAHWRAHHPGEEPLDRRGFHRQEVERRWGGVRRCC